MDYRKAAVFGENWSASRFKVLPYFAVEKAVLMEPGVERVLDLGCANGWNMSRFGQYGRSSFGLDMVPERVKLAEAARASIGSEWARCPACSRYDRCGLYPTCAASYR